MQKLIFGIFIFSLFSTHFNQIAAQSLGLNFLFSPSVRIGIETMPLASKDSNHLKINRLNLICVVPFGGKANLKLSELNAGYKQNFFTMNLGARNLNNKDLNESKTNIQNINFALTHINLRVGKGTIVYMLNFGALNSSQTGTKLNPFGMAAVAYVRLLGLRKQNIYGAALTYSFGRFLPIPIIGINRKISKKMDFQMLLPASIELSHRLNGKMNLSLATSLNIFRSYLEMRAPYNSTSNLQSFHVQSVLSFQANLTNKTSLILQSGVAYLRKLNFYEEQNSIQSHDLAATLLLNAQIRIDLGKSLVSSQLFGSE